MGVWVLDGGGVRGTANWPLPPTPYFAPSRPPLASACTSPPSPPPPALAPDAGKVQRDGDFPHVTSSLVKGALGLYSAFPALAVAVDDVTLAEMHRIRRVKART